MAHSVPCEFYISLKGLCSDLQCEDKIRRKLALQQINKKIFIDTNLNEADYREVFGKIHMYILKCLGDNSEVCREKAIEIITNMIEKLDLNDYYLTYIFPVLVQRIGTAELIEDSEELRLALVNLLEMIITKYAGTDYLVPFLNDIVQILSQTVVDKYPKAKEGSCACIIKLAAALPKHFHLQCESLIKPVLKCFIHQHYRVRIAAIKALGEIMLHGRGNAVQDGVGPLAEKLFDQTGSVRCAVAETAAKLLMEHRDRYSHFHRLLPLILTGLCDEVPDTKIEAERLWEQVGLLYLKENENDLKDQLDFTIESTVQYQEDVTRPNLGCRVLVQRNASKILGALCIELTSWQDDIRVRCAQLLCTLVLHCEESFTQCLQDALPTMYVACADTDKRVSDNVMTAARLIGTFIPVKTWTSLVLPAMQQISTNKAHGYLRVLNSALSGTSTEKLQSISGDIYEILVSEDFRCSRRVEIQTEVLKCCAILAPYNNKNENLFLLLISVSSLSQAGSDLSGQASDILREMNELPKYVASILERFNLIDASQWTDITSDRYIFNNLMKEWTDCLIGCLELTLPVLLKALDMNADPEARAATFIALSTMLQNTKFYDASDIKKFLQLLIQDVLLPSLVWRAGRIAEALRTVAACCLCDISSHSNITLANDEQNEKLLSTLISLAEDAPFRTRIYGIKALTYTPQSENETFLQQWIMRAYPTLMKRLDDPTDVVRLEAFSSLGKIVDKINSDNIHLQHITDSVLLHVDDPNENIQKAALDVLKTISRKDQSYLYNKIQDSKEMFMNKKVCESLVEYMDSLKM